MNRIKKEAMMAKESLQEALKRRARELGVHVQDMTPDQVDEVKARYQQESKKEKVLAKASVKTGPPAEAESEKAPGAEAGEESPGAETGEERM
jgi:hypothetical protein